MTKETLEDELWGNVFAKIKQYGLNYEVLTVLKQNFNISKTMKNKETLEEAAEKYAESNQYDLEYYDEGGYQGIEVKSFAEKLVDFTTKWQAERMYSDEEVLKLLNHRSFDLQFKKDVKTSSEWFEKFKK